LALFEYLAALALWLVDGVGAVERVNKRGEHNGFAHSH
jgi:hypothetical protein